MLDFWGKYKGFDEIIFERRNKEYGAYRLRKDYVKSILVALLISVFISSSITIIPFLIVKNKVRLPVKMIGFDSSHLQSEYLKIPFEDTPDPPKKPGSPKDKKNNPDLNQSRPELVRAADNDQKGKNLSQLDQDKTKYFLKDAENEKRIDQASGYEITDSTSISADLVNNGDLEGFRAWVQRTINYPDSALLRGISGKVTVSFFVENDGSVNDIKVLRGVNKIIDNEVIETLKNSPKWTRSTQSVQGRIRYSLTITFQLAV